MYVKIPLFHFFLSCSMYLYILLEWSFKYSNFVMYFPYTITSRSAVNKPPQCYATSLLKTPYSFEAHRPIAVLSLDLPICCHYY